MKCTQMTVIGEPLTCGVNGCYEPATILLRQVDSDGDDAQLIYCEICWIATRQAYAPLTARDDSLAVREASAVLRTPL